MTGDGRDTIVLQGDAEELRNESEQLERAYFGADDLAGQT